MSDSLKVFIYQMRKKLSELIALIADKKKTGKPTHKEEYLVKLLRLSIFALRDCASVLTPEEREKIKQLVVKKTGYTSVIDIAHIDPSYLEEIDDSCFSCFMNFQDYFCPTHCTPSQGGNNGGGGGTTDPLPRVVKKVEPINSGGSVLVTYTDDTTEQFPVVHNYTAGTQGGIPPWELEHLSTQEKLDLLALLYKPATISLSIANNTPKERGSTFNPVLSGSVIPNKDIIGQKTLAAGVTPLTLPNQTNSFSNLAAPAITDTTTYTYTAQRTGKTPISAQARVEFFFPFYFAPVQSNFLSLSPAQIEAAVKNFSDKRLTDKAKSLAANNAPLSGISYSGQNIRMCIAYPVSQGLPREITDPANDDILSSFSQAGSPRIVNFSFAGFAPVPYYVFINNLNVNLTAFRINLLF